MAPGNRPILIAGAGIGGLTTALGLAQRGLSCRVLERRHELSEAGAGIQLGPNAMQVLNRLGVGERLREVAGQPESIEVSIGATGRHIAHLPLGAAVARMYGAPYLVCHRADLQDVLADAISGQRLIQLELGFEVSGFEEAEDGVHVLSGEGETRSGVALVGADGLWSSVRGLLDPGFSLKYSGKMAARALVPTSLAPARFAAPVTGVWLGGDAHVVHYPIRGGQEIAVVVIVDEPLAREGWGGEIAALDVLHRLSGFSPELIDFLMLAPSWRAWSLYDPTPLASWSRGAVGLLGDAAHPILPFLAQGGAMAIEDSETMSALFARTGAKPQEVFAEFEKLRRARVLKVQDASRENGRIYHLSGPIAWARNAALAVLPGGLMMDRYDWLYGWNGDGIWATAGAG